MLFKVGIREQAVIPKKFRTDKESVACHTGG
jgi:hypothetical protein